MAPPKSKAEGKAVATSSRVTTRSMDRKTRSDTKRSGGNSGDSPSSKLMKFESPEKKKRKTKATDSGAKKKEKKEEEDAAVEVKKEEGATDDEDVAAEEDDSGKRKIAIERCNQCNSFKTRANQVKAGLEEAVPGVIVTVNADKPRRGCFEIREEGGETFISLLDMKRPFTAMKELDMDHVIADIVEKIK